MRKLKLSDISTNNGMPVKSGTIQHIQLAYTEAVAGAAKGLIRDYDSGKYYVLNGIVDTGTGGDVDISAGAIFYNGEVYLVDAVSFTPGSGEVAVGTITKTYYVDGVKADTVTFTDGVARSIHEIYTIVFASASSGSGDVDFKDIVMLVESRRYVGATGQPAFSNSWANDAGENINFRKNHLNNTVTIAGILAAHNVQGTPSAVFTLPVGYRPDVSKSLTCFGIISGVGWFPISMNVGTDGVVSMSSQASATYLVHIGEIIFSLT